MRGRRMVRVVVLVVRVVLGCIFIASSLSKIRQPYDFLGSIYGFELVGPKMGILVAMVLPWLELFVGICLVGGVFVGGALLVSIAMGAMFTFVVGSAIYRGLDISCGCFNPADSSVIGYWTLIRAVVILLAAISAYLLVLRRQAGLHGRSMAQDGGGKRGW